MLCFKISLSCRKYCSLVLKSTLGGGSDEVIKYALVICSSKQVLYQKQPRPWKNLNDMYSFMHLRICCLVTTGRICFI